MITDGDMDLPDGVPEATASLPEVAQAYEGHSAALAAHELHTVEPAHFGARELTVDQVAMHTQGALKFQTAILEWWAPGVRWKVAATALEAGVSLADVAAAMRIDPEGVQSGLVWWMTGLHRNGHGDDARFARLAELIGLTSPTRR